MPRWLDGRCVAASHSPLTNTTTTATTTGETKKFQTNKKKTIPFDGTIGKTHFRGPKWRWPNWVGGWGGAETKKKNNNKKPRKKNWGRNQNWIGTLICKILSFKKKKETGVVENHGCRFYSLVSTRFLLHSPSSSTSFSLACPSDSTVSSDSSSGPIWEKKKKQNPIMEMRFTETFRSTSTLSRLRGNSTL